MQARHLRRDLRASMTGPTSEMIEELPEMDVLDTIPAYAISVYVSGPMTGHRDHNFPAFAAASAVLRDEGYRVIDPGEKGVIEGFEWIDYLKHDLHEILACDQVFVLPGWRESKGSRLEVTMALGLGMEVFDYTTREKVFTLDTPAEQFVNPEVHEAVDQAAPLRPSGHSIPNPKVSSFSWQPLIETGSPKESALKDYLGDEPILEEAHTIVNGDRRKVYSHPMINFERICRFWNGVLKEKMLPGQEVTEEDHALMMIGVKMARLMETPDHRDTIMDIAGYAQTYEMVVANR